MQVQSKALIVGLAAAAAVAGGAFLVASRFLYKRRLDAARRKWAASGVVVLHRPPRPKGALALLPSTAAVESFLRAAEVDYTVESEFPLGPRSGLTPWVTLRGEEVEGGATVVIEELARRMGKDLR